jgi:hypothetical protein
MFILIIILFLTFMILNMILPIIIARKYKIPGINDILEYRYQRESTMKAFFIMTFCTIVLRFTVPLVIYDDMNGQYYYYLIIMMNFSLVTLLAGLVGYISFISISDTNVMYLNYLFLAFLPFVANFIIGILAYTQKSLYTYSMITFLLCSILGICQILLS